MIEQVLQKLIVVFGGNSTEFSEATEKVMKQADNLRLKMLNIGQTLSMSVSAPLAALKGVATYSFASFDDAMTKSTSIMDGVTEDIKKQMEDQAKAIAWNTQTSATDAASAYYFLASAGKTAEQSLKSLGVVNQFAVAGAFEMERATELLADTQAALGLATADATQDMLNMTRVSDVLIKGNNIANASAEQLAKSLTTKSGAALRLLNKEVEEGVAVLAAYAAQGIKGEMAGEKLSIVLRETQHAAANHRDEWNKLGIQLYDSEGNMLKIWDIIGQLEEKFGDLSDEQKYAAFTMLGFRSESMGAIAPLIGQTEAMKDFYEKLNHAGGATDEVAVKQRSFMTELQIMKNRVNVAAIELGQQLAPSLRMVNAAISEGLEIWTNLNPALQSAAAHIITIAAAAGPVAYALGSIPRPIWEAVIPAFNSLGGAISTAFTALRVGALTALVPIAPYVLIIGGIAAAVAAVTYAVVGPQGMVDGWNYAKSALQSFWDSTVGFFSNFQHNMTALLSWVRDNWQTLFVDLGMAVVTFLGNMTSNFFVGIETLIRLQTAYIGWLTTAIPAAFQYVFSEEMIRWVVEGAVGMIEWMGQTMVYLGEIVTAGVMGISEVILQITTSMWNVMTRTAVLIKDIMWGIFTGEFPDPFAMMEEMARIAMEETMAVAEKVHEKVGAAMDKAGEVLKDKVEMLKGDFDAGASDINFFNTAGDILKDQVGKLKGPLEGFEATTLTGPNLIMTTTKATTEVLNQTTESATAAYDETAGQIQKLQTEKDKLGTPVYFTVKGDFDAVGKGSAEALQRLQDYRNSVILASDGTMVGAAPEMKKKETEKDRKEREREEKLLEVIAKNTAPDKGAVTIKAAKLGNGV